jgi:hypothetical protein
MKRNTLLIVVVVIAGFFLLFNPLKLLQGAKGDVVRPSADKEAVTGLQQFAQANWRSAQDYVLSCFATHDIVLLGEFYKIRQNVELVNTLIPRLYAAGVRNLGIEYALSEDQAQIDALVTAPKWDEAKARAITLDWLVSWGYQEYIDLYKTAWQVNSGRPAGAKPFRVVGLNVRQNWEFLINESDASDPQTVAKIHANGVPDVHIAEVIEKEFVARGEKALVYCGTQHVFTRYVNADYAKNAADMKLADTRRAGNIVFAKIGAKAFSISLHAPWPDRNQKTGLAYPAEGAIDALIDLLPPDRRNAGWNTAGTPLGALPVRSGSYSNGKTDMTLADVFDGYVIQGPMAEYTTVTAIPDFVLPQNAERAARDYPGPKPTPLTPMQVNERIIQDVQQLAKMLAQFR